MSDPLEVPAHETETVRVFAVDLPENEARELATGDDGAALREALGASVLDPGHVEAFPAADLEGVGLPRYLVEGLGIEAEAVEADRARLEDETGFVVIVHSPAFGGTDQQLAPRPPLRHVGTYRMTPTEPARVTLPSDLAATAADAPLVAPFERPPSNLQRLPVAFGLVAAVLVVLLLVWAFGAAE